MTKLNRTAALTALALAAIPAALLAQPAPGARPGPQTSVTKADAQARAAEMFARMDANKDGKLDQADRSARQAERFARLDTDKDGKLSQQEFAVAQARREGMAAGRKMAGERRRGGAAGGQQGMMARMADANQDGAISRDEFLAAQGKHFAMMDANKDGTVTPEERQAARAKMREHMRAMRDGDAAKAGHEGH